MRMIARHAAGLAAILGLALTTGCAAISDLNPFDRGSSAPLPPVTGNVIATSSSENLPGPLDNPDTVGTQDVGTGTGEQLPDPGAADTPAQDF